MYFLNYTTETTKWAKYSTILKLYHQSYETEFKKIATKFSYKSILRKKKYV